MVDNEPHMNYDTATYCITGDTSRNVSRDLTFLVNSDIIYIDNRFPLKTYLYLLYVL